jgi:hypothetical protein
MVYTGGSGSTSNMMEGVLRRFLAGVIGCSFVMLRNILTRSLTSILHRSNYNYYNINYYYNTIDVQKLHKKLNRPVVHEHFTCLQRLALQRDWRTQLVKSILKDPDDGVLQSGLLSFWTLSIVWYSKKTYNVSKIGSIFVLGCREEGHQLSWVRLKELTSITGQPMSEQCSACSCSDLGCPVIEDTRTQLSRCPYSLHLRMKTDPVFETLFFFVIPDDGQSPKTH